MSPKNKVPQLNTLSLKYISSILTQLLSDDEGLNYDNVAKYLLDATYEVLQDLLKIILNIDNLDASTRFSCLQMILREDVRRLDTGLFPHSYYEKILDVISVKGAGLQHLNMKGIWLRDYPASLTTLLDKLKNLRVLIIPHMPDDSVLQSAMQCYKLSVLDISGECNFTINGLRNLRSNNLNVLSIGMYGKKSLCEGDNEDCVDTIVCLIMNLPNLTVLKTYSFVGSALLKIFREYSEYQTKLKYIHDTNTTLEILNAIANLCPNLESVNFNSPEENVLSNLSCLKRLNSLKISEPNSSELLSYLKISGSQLQVLKLNVVKGETLDISLIGIFAPELHTLECYKSKLTCFNPDNYFMNLQNLEVLYCDISDNVLKYLLLNSPFLRRIVVGDVIRMTDGDIFRLCAECEFQSLEELWFSCARGLTATTVELLMGHCPNLKVLGQLTGWDVAPNDLDYLRAVILSTNTDLTLLPLETTG